MKTPAIKFLIFLLLILTVQASYSQQRETYDIISYAIPKGWKKETTNSGVTFTITNNRTGDWCMITVYKSMSSSGNLATDFDHEWNELVTKAYPNTVKPTPELVTQDGWSVQSGFGNFTWQNQQSVILLNVISGYGRVTSVTVTTNTKAYQTEAEQFLDSIEMQKREDDNTTPSEPIKSQPLVSNTVGGTGITKSTTTFSDGWVAQAMDNYVLVTKENTKFFIYYGIPNTLPLESDESTITKANWERFIMPRYGYALSNLKINPDVGSFGGSFNYYAEGLATERSTGKQVFIGFRTIIEGGVHFCVAAVSPDKEEYQKHFPNLNMLNDIRNSNRFAVTKEDVIGDWSSSSGSALQYYNVYTGQNAGMQFSQGGQEFFFRDNGEYNANISGAFGNMGGSQVVFDNKYQGNYTVTDWEIVLTKYEPFTCYFEAVKGGRILHVAKKNAPGVRYALVKVK